jgi:hypothetical protein
VEVIVLGESANDPGPPPASPRTAEEKGDQDELRLVTPGRVSDFRPALTRRRGRRVEAMAASGYIFTLCGKRANQLPPSGGVALIGKAPHSKCGGRKPMGVRVPPPPLLLDNVKRFVGQCSR